MSLPPFVLVTGNPSKAEEASRILGFRPEIVPVDLPEIQSLDIGEVLEAKADEAWRRVGRALVVEETSLELEALQGFPGPLVKWMLEAVGSVGIARTAHALGDRRVRARCRLLFVDGERRLAGEGVTEGELVLEARGSAGFGWDPVFRPAESDRTYAELGPTEKDRIGHRGRAWRDLLSALLADGTR